MVRDSYGAMRPPAWLGGLVAETFFAACGVHDNRKKNEKNIFCLECCRSICPHCSATSSHRHHPLLQVRRYVYNDVVRLDDLEKLIDCSCVQAYTINSAKVVFLKQRPQSRPFKGSGNICLTCDRILQDPFHFCSLFCKVDHVMMQGQDLAGILHRINDSDISFSGFFDGLEVEEEGGITPNSILQSPLRNDGGTGNGGSGSSVDVENNNSKKNKRSNKEKKCSGSNNTSTASAGFLPQIVLSLSNKRKGAAPQRAPLS